MWQDSVRGNWRSVLSGGYVRPELSNPWGSKTNQDMLPAGRFVARCVRASNTWSVDILYTLKNEECQDEGAAF